MDIVYSKSVSKEALAIIETSDLVQVAMESISLGLDSVEPLDKKKEEAV